jgi:hypothetical protein
MHPAEAQTPPRGVSRTARNEDGGGGVDGAQRLASALGWFSLGLGLAQVVAPASVARLAGAEPRPDTLRLMRALGLREISSGVGILSGRRTEDWVRARVAGDLMDLALLARVLTDDGAERGRTLAASLAVAGVTALDAVAASKLKSRSAGARAGASRTADMEPDTEQAARTIRRAITIRRSPDEVAAFWREHATETDALAEQVRFVPASGGRGTEVHLERTYEKPGKIAEIIGKIRHDDPAQYAFDELFALKQILETGDVVISDAWLNGPHKPHAARPE